MQHTRFDQKQSDADALHDVRHAYDPRFGVWVLKELISRADETLLWRTRFEAGNADGVGRGTMVHFDDEPPAAEAARLAREAIGGTGQIEQLGANGRTSFSLKVSKAVVAFLRHAEEEALMAAEAKRRHATAPRPEPGEITVHERRYAWPAGVIVSGALPFDPTPYEGEIRALVQEMPYLRRLIAGRKGARALFASSDGKAWELRTRYISDRSAHIFHRARIAQGFGLSEEAHWGTVKAEIRRRLLPRANQLLQLASVRRLLDEALARGRRALVIGPWVFWYEPDGGLGWIVKEVGTPKGQSAMNDEATWEAGTILSKNHGRIVVLPYRKADGELVTGYTRNVAGDGPAKPRHRTQYVEIPFDRLDSDLMIGLLGELPYE